MPLPPALAARLAKRGIIPKKEGSQGEAAASGRRGEEEVFAESYDGDQDARDRHRATGRTAVRGGSNQDDKTRYMVSAGLTELVFRTRFKLGLFQGYPCCPNKWNVYHECCLWCQNTWAPGKLNPDPEYLKRFKRMMDKYGPLPDEWKEKYDPGTGRHYFWCTRTDRVSWLPPGHPKAKITEAASRVREVLASQVTVEEEEDDDDEDDQAMDLDSDMESDEEDDDEDREIRDRREREKEKRRSDQERYRRDNRSRRERGGGGGGERPDPMDPSSYSDAPKGNWASGLENAR